MNILSDTPVLFVYFLLILPFLWFILLLVLGIWSLKHKKYRWIPATLLSIPFIILPVVGGALDKGHSGPSDFGPPGFFGVPLLFFLSPVLASTELERRWRSEYYLKIKSNPDVIWTDKIYENSYESLEWNALMQYWTDYPPDFTEKELITMIEAGRTFYLKYPQLGIKYLEDYHNNWISNHSKNSLNENLVKNPNLPIHILNKISTDREYGYNLMRIANEQIELRKANNVEKTPP